MNQGVREIKQLYDKVFFLGYHKDGDDVYEHIVELILINNSIITVDYSKTFGLMTECKQTRDCSREKVFQY